MEEKASCTLLKHQLRAALDISTQAGHASAETELAAAQAEYQALGAQLGVTNCLRKLGILRGLQGDTVNVLRNLEAACEVYLTHGGRHSPCAYNVLSWAGSSQSARA